MEGKGKAEIANLTHLTVDEVVREMNSIFSSVEPTNRVSGFRNARRLGLTMDVDS
jgi:hypothetical protein